MVDDSQDQFKVESRYSNGSSDVEGEISVKSAQLVFRAARLLIVTILLAESVMACGSLPGAAPVSGQPGVELVSSNARRDTAPDASDQDLAELTAGNQAFAIDLYQALRSIDGNLFYSPYSISTALGMVYAGARGSTEQQMGQVLHYRLAQDRLHPAFNALDLSLTGEKDENFTLNVANSAWAQQGYKFLPEYLDLIARNYGAGFRLVDFTAEAPREQARLAINDWVSQKTEDKIKDLIAPGLLDNNTRLVLANAIYFKADWQDFFTDTNPAAPFNLLDSKKVLVPMMKRRAYAGYTSGQSYQAVGLPYKGGRMQMVVLLPDEGQFEAIESSLGVPFMEQVLAGLENKDVELYFPKFKFSSEFNLKKTLSDMGMPDAFGAADFSGMTGSPALAIKEVVHKAFVAVDEYGTEAAAATGVAMWESAPAGDPLRVIVDRPFIFFIHDTQTGTILFAGRVLNPKS
jgi:serpin B